MLLPESEAKFKYCPLLKTHDDKMKFCLGGMCMMWRAADGDKGYCGAAGGVAGLSAAMNTGASGSGKPGTPSAKDVPGLAALFGEE